MEPRAQPHLHPVSDFFSSESAPDEDGSSSVTSSDEEPEKPWTMPENHDDRMCSQVLVIFTTITCVSIVLSLIFLDSADETLPQKLSYYGHTYRASAYHKRRHYKLGERAERFLLCTLGDRALERRVYPADGLCNWIVYTHVSYDAQNDSIVPDNSQPWSLFVQMRSQYTLTGLMPSHEWTNLSLSVLQARSLNRTLTALRMVGLAFLNVRIVRDHVSDLAAVLATLAGTNPGMFLVLGATFHRLSDGTASRLIPGWLLDQLVTPLSLFVLETHLPAPGYACIAGFSTALQPVYGQRHESLTFRGARTFLKQPALRYANSTSLARCVSVTAGVLAFHVLDGHRAELGASCSHWSLEKLTAFCKLSSVSVNVEAASAYGNTTGIFFSFEAYEHMWSKMRPVLRSLLQAEVPTCLAVYSLDLDAPYGLCPFEHERQARLVYTAYDVIQTITVHNSSGDSIFASNTTEESLNPL